MLASREIESVTRRVGRWGFSKVYPWNGRIHTRSRALRALHRLFSTGWWRPRHRGSATLRKLARPTCDLCPSYSPQILPYPGSPGRYRERRAAPSLFVCSISDKFIPPEHMTTRGRAGRASAIFATKPATYCNMNHETQRPGSEQAASWVLGPELCNLRPSTLHPAAAKC